MSEKEERAAEREIEELKVVKDMIASWLEKLGVVVRDTVNAVMSSLDGKKLGQEVVELYNSLRAAGLPEQLVQEMVRDFYKRKLELAPSLSDLLKVVTKAVSGALEGRPEEREE